MRLLEKGRPLRVQSWWWGSGRDASLWELTLDQGASVSAMCGGPALCSEMGTRPVPQGFKVSEGDSNSDAEGSAVLAGLLAGSLG